jgi:predicted  nucleic acid-binding Zn-ribbon protein
LAEIYSLLKEDIEERLAKARMENTENSQSEVSKRLRKAEQDVLNQRIKIEQTESALYGGKIRNPKELQDLQNESASLKRYLAVLEDRQLEAMIALEEAEEAYRAATKDYTVILALMEQKNATLVHEKSNLLKDTERLKEERKAIAGSILDLDLQLYEQLRVQRGGLAVARVVDRTCSACGSTLSSALLNAAQLPNQVSRCSTCGRILYAG